MAILKKEIDGRYILLNDNRQIMSAALSLKNCQSIERGYDLDELAKIEYPICEVWNEEDSFIRKLAFQKGFKKALELNADKRFTLKEMTDCWNKALTFQTHKETLGEHIQSLQQKEWDVEIEMDEYEPLYGEGSTTRPKRDNDGCIILKRK